MKNIILGTINVSNLVIKEYCNDLYITFTGTTSTVVTTAGCSDQPRKFADMSCNNGVGNMNSTSGIEISILTYHCRYPQADKDASNPDSLDDVPSPGVHSVAEAVDGGAGEEGTEAGQEHLAEHDFFCVIEVLFMIFQNFNFGFVLASTTLN